MLRNSIKFDLNISSDSVRQNRHNMTDPNPTMALGVCIQVVVRDLSV
jgi:hypothetical protein